MLDGLFKCPKLSAAFYRSIAASLALMTLGCSQHDVQTTSGESYLAKHKLLKSVGTEETPKAAKAAPSALASLDRALQHVADIQPTLSFPARIGVAKIGCHIDRQRHADEVVRMIQACDGMQRLLSEELEAWSQLSSNLGASHGRIVPLNSLIMDQAEREAVKIGTDVKTLTAIDRARLGAARQHIDAVLIYETLSGSTEQTNALAHPFHT